MLFGVLGVFILTMQCVWSDKSNYYNRHSSFNRQSSRQSDNIHNGTPCQASTREKGFCVPISQCPVLLSRVTRRQVSFLTQRYSCGYSAGKTLFCCPENSGRVSLATSTTTEKIYSTTTGSLQHRNQELLPDECGDMVEDKILGGNETKIDEYPWLALLNYKHKDGTTEFKCGGSLISSRYVLTAAHCLKLPIKGIQLISVRLGEYDISSEKDCQKGVCIPEPINIPVESTKAHEGFRRRMQYNDIGLVRLAHEVSFTGFIKPACIPMGKVLTKSYENKELIVAGWGNTGTSTPGNTNVKQSVKIKGQNQDECAKFYKTVSDYKLKLESQICAGDIGKDACSGDSGGPLMSRDVIKYQIRFHVTGLVSFGELCSANKQSNKYGIYTKTAYYVDWILNNLEP